MVAINLRVVNRSEQSNPARSICSTGPDLVSVCSSRSGCAVGGNPHHISDSISQLFPFSAIEIDIAPCVIHRSDGKTCNITSNQMEHFEASRSRGANCYGVVICGGSVAGFFVPRVNKTYVTHTARQPKQCRKTCGIQDACDGFFGSSDEA